MVRYTVHNKNRPFVLLYLSIRFASTGLSTVGQSELGSKRCPEELISGHILDWLKNHLYGCLESIWLGPCQHVSVTKVNR